MIFNTDLTSSIVGFHGVDYGKNEIDRFLAETLKNATITHDIDDWTVQFLILLGKEGISGTFKKGVTFTSEKTKSYTIYITLPTDKQTPWGIREKLFAPHPIISEDKLHKIITTPQQFNTLKDYTIDTAKQGITQILRNGITVKKCNIKI